MVAEEPHVLTKLFQRLHAIAVPKAARHPSAALVRCGLLSLVVMSLISLTATTIVVSNHVRQRTYARLDHDLLVINHSLSELGPVHLENSHLMAGHTVLEGNEAFVDVMSSMLGADVTVFRGDVRIATTLRLDGQRLVGTTLEHGLAHTALFDRHEPYRGPAYALGVKLYAAYDPLFGPRRQMVGAVFVGMPWQQFHSDVVAAQRSILLTSVVVLSVAGLVFALVARPLKRQIDTREKELRDIAGQLEIAFKNMSDGLSLFDADQRLVTSNDLYATLYGIDPLLIYPGITRSEMVTVHERVGTRAFRKDLVPASLSLLQQDVVVPFDERLVETATGKIIVMRYRFVPGGGFVSTHRDVTLQVRDQEQMRFLALHDPLTGLANRTAFNAALMDQLSSLTPCFTVLLIDLDRFKEVNDVHGHGAGDALLCEIAIRLRRQVFGASVAARLGGDEFALLIENTSTVAVLPSIAQAILDSLSDPVTFAGISIRPGASMGITSVVDASFTLDEVLSQADLALYAAKTRGRGVFDFFRPALALARNSRLDVERELLHALDNGAFVLHYQPQYDIKTEELVGFEALLRWQHPTRGLLQPSEFIKVTEETGLIVRLGAWVIEQACRDASAWGANIRVAVNVSATQFARPHFVVDTIAAAQHAGLRPDLLEVEVTETVLVEDTPEIIDALSALRCAGMRVALDDFGTGYASLLYLYRLPFDCIKIDQAFVRDLGNAQQANSIVGIVIQLAQSFGAISIAEGVENHDQLVKLRLLGCDIAQGFHFDNAMPFSAALAIVRDQPSGCQGFAAEQKRLILGPVSTTRAFSERL